MRSRQLRIIAGVWRSRRFEFPDISSIRPTPDRLRETVFNWLQVYIKNTYCLDLFAGSGALGFEALSRGAKHVCFVDQHPRVVANLKRTAELFGVENTDIYSQKAERFLTQCNNTFDVIFLDPPFDENHLTHMLQLIKERSLLNADGRLVIESSSDLVQIEMMNVQVYKSAQAGLSHIYLAGF